LAVEVVSEIEIDFLSSRLALIEDRVAELVAFFKDSGTPPPEEQRQIGVIPSEGDPVRTRRG
jgi:hypothetical protein